MTNCSSAGSRNALTAFGRKDGKPQGREKAHLELAKLAIAQEDAQQEMLRPIETPNSEPIEAVVNQAEFPTLTDQGEQHNPGEIAEDPFGSRG